MKLTEEEARTKWCPIAHPHFGPRADEPALDNPRQANPTFTPPTLPRCRASVCMLWEWDKWQERGRCGLRRVR